MSEHYIQSQYLLKQITRDFFNDHSDTIRIKDPNYQIESDEEIIDSDSESEKDDHLESDEFFYLESENALNYEFDVCDNEKDILKTYTIYLCGYKQIQSSQYPFLTFLLSENENEYTFPKFDFKCPRNISVQDDENSPKHVYFENFCTTSLLQYVNPSTNDDVFEN